MCTVCTSLGVCVTLVWKRSKEAREELEGEGKVEGKGKGGLTQGEE